MRIGKTVLNIENLSPEDLAEVIKQAKDLRARKLDARSYCTTLKALLTNTKENGFSFCEKHTGAILRAEDYVLYDDDNDCLLEGEWEC